MKKLIFLMAILVTVLGFQTTPYAFFIDFENGFGRDQQPIDDIVGVTFEVTGGYNWIYGDSNSNNWNTRSIDLGKSWNAATYQHYGYVFAFLGTDNNAGSGKIDFTNNDGTWFRTGYTSNSTFYLDGYDTLNNLIASTSGPGNTSGADMGWLMITAPIGQLFDYVIVHDTGNYFLVDNMTGDASGVNVPEPSTLLLLASGLIGLAGIRKKFKI